jgi:CDP-paratose 2-epimerase
VTRRLIVTGSSGLIGSEAVRHFSALGYEVHGFDNNMRMDFFGQSGDTRWNLAQLQQTCPSFRHYDLDIRDRAGIFDALQRLKPSALIHCAAQPSHDLAGTRPFDDFDVNAVGTLNLLEAMRRHAPEAPFVLLSTNKVYGDVPNELPLVELPMRWDYALPEHYHGVDETLRIDRCKHSLFGASKVAADVLAQEYGRYFGMPVCALRCGCLTGAAHSGVELHGFLSYLCKCVVGAREYRIYGYKGKQVRDNIHGFDVVTAIQAIIEAPRAGEVYNLGGTRRNSISMLKRFTHSKRARAKASATRSSTTHAKAITSAISATCRSFASIIRVGRSRAASTTFWTSWSRTSCSNLPALVRVAIKPMELYSRDRRATM